jgi:hypothetical protein
MGGLGLCSRPLAQAVSNLQNLGLYPALLKLQTLESRFKHEQVIQGF